MIRNIIGQKRSYTITIPKNWVERRGLKSGDAVRIEEDGDMLIMASEHNHIPKEVELKLEGNDEQFLRTSFLNMYARGYDKIKMYYENDAQKEIISKTLSDYVFGFEVVDDNGTRLIAESISEPSSDKYDVILRKIFLNINELLSDFPDALKGNDSIDKDEFKRIYKYVNFCKRDLNRNKVYKENAFFESGLITYLSIIQRSIYHAFSRKEDRVYSGDLIEWYEKIQSLFHGFYDGFIRKDFKKLSNTNEKVKEFHYYLFEKDIQSDERILRYYLLEISRTINRAINISRGIIA